MSRSGWLADLEPNEVENPESCLGQDITHEDFGVHEEGLMDHRILRDGHLDKIIHEIATGTRQSEPQSSSLAIWLRRTPLPCTELKIQKHRSSKQRRIFLQTITEEKVAWAEPNFWLRKIISAIFKQTTDFA